MSAEIVENGGHSGDNIVIVSDNSEEALGETSAARVIAEAARSAALAHDEVFFMKQELAVAHETTRLAVSAEVQPLREKLAAVQSELDRAISERILEEQNAEEQRKRADNIEAYCHNLLMSRSWRITAPLRALGRLVSQR